jgi:competence protein ComEC
VRDWLAARGVVADTAAPGEEGSLGQINYRILWPTRIIRNEGSDPNNASIAVVFTVGGVRILLPGDLESASQEALISGSGPIGADVVKIPHHGSANQSPRLISWSGARLAIVSAGLHNMYGHPAQQTLSAWQRAGAAVARTDQDGDVAIVRNADADVVLIPRKRQP